MTSILDIDGGPRIKSTLQGGQIERSALGAWVTILFLGGATVLLAVLTLDAATNTDLRIVLPVGGLMSLVVLYVAASIPETITCIEVDRRGNLVVWRGPFRRRVSAGEAAALELLVVRRYRVYYFLRAVNYQRDFSVPLTPLGGISEPAAATRFLPNHLLEAIRQSVDIPVAMSEVHGLCR